MSLKADIDLIVKSGGAQFPGLAVNEFVCMTMAKAAGIEAPELRRNSFMRCGWRDTP
jgi:hypothetical protein